MTTDLYSRDPEAALQLLRANGATCGAAAAAEAPKACAPRAGCTWPSGAEVCLHTLNEAGSTAPAPVVGAPVALVSGVGIMLIGVAIGWMLRRPR